MSNGIGYICDVHNCAVPAATPCKHCVEEWKQLPAVETMTTQERADEFEKWLNKSLLTVDFSDFKDRLCALLGRGIWTNELATSNHDHLMAEIRGKIQPPQTMDDLVNILPPHLRVITLEGDAAGTVQVNVIEPEDCKPDLDLPE